MKINSLNHFGEIEIFGESLWVACTDNQIHATAFSRLYTPEYFCSKVEKRLDISLIKNKGLPEDISEKIKTSVYEFGANIFDFNTSAYSSFKQKVWKACLQIPVGKTQTYAQLASKVGKPKASRAVGSALSSNPIPVLIPCHRVVKSDGSVGGYAFGVELKKMLLKNEKTNYSCGNLAASGGLNV